MGSGQSSHATDDVAGKVPVSSGESSQTSGGEASTRTDQSQAAPKPKKQPPPNESGYAKAERICRKKKRAYDACYTAALSSKEEDCSDLFESYRSCFLRVMAKDMEKRGVKVSENSMIGEYKDDVEDDE